MIKVNNKQEIQIISEDPNKNEFVYESAHYRYICDAPLKTSLVRKFATLFEATREFCKAIPISSNKAHYENPQKKLMVHLVEKIETYYERGGPPGSAGVYFGGKDIVLVPLSSLGVQRVGSSYMFDHSKSSKTLPHELAHQITDSAYYQLGARGWFSEGLAEYIAVSPYRNGKINVKSNRNDIVNYVTEYDSKKGGRNLGDEIRLRDLKSFMTMSYQEFTLNGNKNYGVGLLLTYYFFHLDQNGDRVAITQFLKALKAGKQGDEALSALLNGRTWDELSDQISKSWRSKGVKLLF